MLGEEVVKAHQSQKPQQSVLDCHTMGGGLRMAHTHTHTHTRTHARTHATHTHTHTHTPQYLQYKYSFYDASQWRAVCRKRLQELRNSSPNPLPRPLRSRHYAGRHSERPALTHAFRPTPPLPPHLPESLLETEITRSPRTPSSSSMLGEHQLENTRAQCN